MIDSQQSLCSRHPEKNAVGTCFSCEKGVCEECAILRRYVRMRNGQSQGEATRTFCADCIDKTIGIKKTAHQRAKWIVAVFVLVAIISGVWFVSNQYPRLKQKAINDYVTAMKAGRPTKEVISKLPWWVGVNTKDNKSNRAPLHWAIVFGRNEIAQTLIEQGADLNAEDYYGGTPMYWAMKFGHDKIARALIEHGADLSAKPYGGTTPLHFTARYCHDKVALILIEHGVDVNAKDIEGNTPLDYVGEGDVNVDVPQKKKQEFQALLQKHGAMTGAELKEK